jgi:hypothetical protein
MNEISQSDFNIFKAKAISRGKLLDRFRLTMIEVKDHIEDEGDRVYFGSSNHAEALKEVIHEMDVLRWDRIIAERPEIDPYEECRKLRLQLSAMEDYALEVTKAITGLSGGGSEMFSGKIGGIFKADLDKCVQVIRDRHAKTHDILVKAVKEKNAAISASTEILACLKDARRLLSDQEAIDLVYIDEVIAEVEGRS